LKHGKETFALKKIEIKPSSWSPFKLIIMISSNASLASEEDRDDDSLILPDAMPTRRLNDVYQSILKGTSAVVSLDALIPPKDAGNYVFRTLMLRLSREVKVLSIRFNNLSQFSIDFLIAWITQNDHIETLYCMGCGIDDKQRQKLEDCWKKNLCGHRTANLGYTLIRVGFDKEAEFKAAQESG
jgi:hypothetical protein